MSYMTRKRLRRLESRARGMSGVGAAPVTDLQWEIESNRQRGTTSERLSPPESSSSDFSTILRDITGGAKDVASSYFGAQAAIARSASDRAAANAAARLASANRPRPGFFQRMNPVTGQVETDWLNVGLIGGGAVVLLGATAFAFRGRR